MRARVCEKMGWTLSEFDEIRAVELFELLEIWRIESMLK